MIPKRKKAAKEPCLIFSQDAVSFLFVGSALIICRAKDGHAHENCQFYANFRHLSINNEL